MLLDRSIWTIGFELFYILPEQWNVLNCFRRSSSGLSITETPFLEELLSLSLSLLLLGFEIK